MRAEAQHVDEEASTVETGAPAEEDIGNVPNPDGFVPASERLPKGFTVATAHAEAVLLDRVKAQLDKHYDQVFLDRWLLKERERTKLDDKDREDEVSRQPPRRPGAHKIDRKVLEAHVAARYTILELPALVKEIFRKPSDESDWKKIEQLRSIVVDAARGIYTYDLDQPAEWELLLSSLPPSGPAVLREDVELAATFMPAGTRVHRHHFASERTFHRPCPVLALERDPLEQLWRENPCRRTCREASLFGCSRTRVVG